FFARLGRYGSDYLVDLVQGRGADTMMDRYGGVLIHLPLALKFDSAGFSAWGFGLDSLNAALQSGRIKLSHVPGIPSKDDLLLTDRGDVLGPALARYTHRPGVMGRALVYRKRQ